MKKLVLFLLLSVAVADSGYAFIFGGGAWRRHYRRHRRGLLSCVEKQENTIEPQSQQDVRDAVDLHLEVQKNNDGFDMQFWDGYKFNYGY